MAHKAFPPYGTVDANDMTPVGRSGRVLYTLAEDRELSAGQTVVLVDRYHPLYDAWPFVRLSSCCNAERTVTVASCDKKHEFVVRLWSEPGPPPDVWCYLRCDPAADVVVSGALALARVTVPPTEVAMALAPTRPPPRESELKVWVSEETKLTFVLAVRFDLAP